MSTLRRLASLQALQQTGRAATDERRQAFVEDYLDLLSQGETREGICRRMHLSWSTLERRLQRQGLPKPPLDAR